MNDAVGTVKWLKENALFGCHIDSCREEVTYSADMLYLTPDGLPACEGCWDHSEAARYAKLGHTDREGNSLLVSELRPFNPFAALQEDE